MKEIIFETERLICIPIEESHAPDLYIHWSNRNVTKYMNIEAFHTIEEAKKMIQFLKVLMEKDEATRYTIIHKETENIIGSCGLNYVDRENNKTEIAYEIGEKYWSKGYGTEIVKGLLQVSFDTYEMHRVEAKVEKENLPSRKLLEKNAFNYEGTLIDGEKKKEKYVDICIYANIKK